jgi:hypothetical protein
MGSNIHLQILGYPAFITIFPSQSALNNPRIDAAKLNKITFSQPSSRSEN